MELRPGDLVYSPDRQQFGVVEKVKTTTCLVRYIDNVFAASVKTDLAPVALGIDNHRTVVAF